MGGAKEGLESEMGGVTSVLIYEVLGGTTSKRNLLSRERFSLEEMKSGPGLL